MVDVLLTDESYNGTDTHSGSLTLMLLVANWPIHKDAKNLKNDGNPGTWVLIC